MKHLILFAIIIALIFLSQASIFLFPSFGIFCTLFIIGVLLFLATFKLKNLFAQETFAYSSIIPFLSLILLSSQIQDINIKTTLSYLILLFTSELYYSLLPRSSHIYHQRGLINIFFILCLGIFMGSTFSFLLPRINGQFFFWKLILIIISSIVEPLYFQGLIQNAASKMSDVFLGSTFAVLLYGFFHATPDLKDLLILIIFASVNAFIYAKWQNIYLIIGFSLSVQITTLLLKNALFIIS